jgi:hypothetical protein
MYAGEQGDRSIIEWYADAVAEYLNCMVDLERRHSISLTTDIDESSRNQHQSSRSGTK